MIKFKLECSKLRKDPDGLYRAIFNVYSGGTSHSIARALTDKTGCQWRSLGCFMDIACVATRSKPKGKLTFYVKS